MQDIKTLISRIVEFRDARNWAQFHKPKDMAISLSLECAELLEHFQWKNDQEVREHILANREALGDELSDILYWVLLFAHDLGIDLQTAFEAKMAKNEVKYPVEKAKDRHTKYDRL
jgi:dCTP diphosphatase